MTALLFEQAAPASPDLVFGAEFVTVPLGPTDLVFDRPASTSTALVFGDDGSTAAPPARVDINISGAFPPLTALLKLIPQIDIAVAGAFPAPTLAVAVRAVVKINVTGAFPVLQALADVTYNTNTQRPTVARLRASAQIGTPIESGIAQPQQHAQSAISGAQSRFTEALRTSAGMRAGFDDARRLPAPSQARFADAAQLPAAQATGLMQEGDRQWLRFFSQFQEADRLATARVQGLMQDGIRDYTAPIRPPFSEAQKLPATKYTGRAGAALPKEHRLTSRFQEAQVPPAGISRVPVAPPLPPPYWGTVLLFECPPLALPHLMFGAQTCYFESASIFYILPARFYMSIHTIRAERLPDLAEVPIFDATVSADSGSYCWSLSATGPASLFAQLAPVNGLPVQLRVWLDGLPFVFAIDAMQRSQKFGQTGISIAGRSVTALIGAPYLRATTRDNAAGAATAQQLALSALQYSGVDLDWGVASGATANGGLIDWLVPAGAWSHSGTPLDAVQAIAQAAGGYLQSHRSAATLLTRHPYGQRIGDASGAPWAWSTGSADVELAPDAIILEGTERKDGPDINAVYVSGTTQGVLALVKRTGSAADKLAQMITDPLMTHADAARQRGLAVLGAAGSKYNVRLELPVLTGPGEPGVLDVGQLVQINTTTPWRGRVRAVSVNAKRPSVRQTITLERHLETA
jgi:hypothetical protein